LATEDAANPGYQYIITIKADYSLGVTRDIPSWSKWHWNLFYQQ